MIQRTFLDYLGLKRFLSHLKTIIPTKTSELQNDSGYLTQHNPVDSSLSDTSENAVQNKVVKGALDGKSDTGHTHGNITNDGKLPTTSRAVVTDANGVIAVSNVTTTELGYVSGVTSSIQAQLNTKLNSVDLVALTNDEIDTLMV